MSDDGEGIYARIRWLEDAVAKVQAFSAELSLRLNNTRSDLLTQTCRVDALVLSDADDDSTYADRIEALEDTLRLDLPSALRRFEAIERRLSAIDSTQEADTAAWADTNARLNALEKDIDVFLTSRMDILEQRVSGIMNSLKLDRAIWDEYEKRLTALDDTRAWAMMSETAGSLRTRIEALEVYERGRTIAAKALEDRQEDHAPAVCPVTEAHDCNTVHHGMTTRNPEAYPSWDKDPEKKP